MKKQKKEKKKIPMRALRSLKWENKMYKLKRSIAQSKSHVTWWHDVCCEWESAQGSSLSNEASPELLKYHSSPTSFLGIFSALSLVEKNRGYLRVLHYQVGSYSVICSERMCKGQTLEKSAFQIFRGGNSAFISSSDELNFQVKLKGEKVYLKQFSPLSTKDGLLV